jgi:hypothetical protein
VKTRRRLERLEEKFPPLPPPPPGQAERERRRREVLSRWVRLTRSALELLVCAEEGDRVARALAELADDWRGPYAHWLGDLADGRCRLPELTPEAMKALLLAWLSDEVDFACVCTGCGLEYPHHRPPPLGEWQCLPGKRPLVGPPPWYDLPAFFRACPHCGASDRDVEWAHLVKSGGRAWQALDGYVGVVTRS